MLAVHMRVCAGANPQAPPCCQPPLQTKMVRCRGKEEEGKAPYDGLGIFVGLEIYVVLTITLLNLLPTVLRMCVKPHTHPQRERERGGKDLCLIGVVCGALNR